MTVFGERLKQTRRSCGKTRREVAGCLGVTEATVLNWERGKSYPRIDAYFKLAELYQFDPNEFLKVVNE